MQVFSEMAQNRVLWVAVLGWVAAQALKVVFPLLLERKLDLKRFFGLGGMPSSHTAVVCALATGVGIASGFHRVEFAISAMLAMVVMTDAAGVRRAAGKQAAALNRIMKELMENGKGFSYETLKELLGHSPFEVLVGALLGILLAFWLV